jgi:hypothetical protein
MPINTDRAQLATLTRSPGRPPKGAATRSCRLSVRIEPRHLFAIDSDMREGETRADVVARWCEERA